MHKTTILWYPVIDQNLTTEDAVRHMVIALGERFSYTRRKEVPLYCLKRNTEAKSCLKSSRVQGKIKLDFVLRWPKCKSPRMPT